MSKITYLHAREILDSRGNPTIEVDIELKDLNGKKHSGRAAVPSGASTGAYEAVELRDKDKRYMGKGVQKAIDNVNTTLSKALIENDTGPQRNFDEKLCALDGTENKGNLGANAILGVSLSFAKAKAKEKNLELFQYFGDLVNNTDYRLPVPMMNILNGGEHANSSVDIQEFMIVPIGAKSFKEALRMGTEIFHHLKNHLHDMKLATSVGDEGGFAPNLKRNEDALEIISRAVTDAGYSLGKDIYFALDVAASELYKDGKYHLSGEGKVFTTDQLIVYYQKLCRKYPIISIEDGLNEEDWDGWKRLTNVLGEKVQIVGDDLFVTNTKRLKKGIDNHSANSILIKLNQIGTVTETIDAISLAKKNHFTSVVSHRSGETEDTTIADLAVGLSTGQIKTGSLCRTDRTCKYNQLLRIEEMLDNAKYAGIDGFRI